MAKKRASGEGTIRQRADGKWEAYTPRDEFGRRKKFVRSTQREALAELAHLRDKGRHAEEEKGARQTVGALLHTWLEVKRGDIRPKTYDSYARTIKGHLDTADLARLRLEKLTADHVEVWYDRLRRSADRTARYAKMILGEALDYAVAKKWLVENVARAKHLKRKAKPPRPIAPLSPAQARALLDAASGHRLEALYRVALSLGLRRGEVLALRWQDVDLDTGTLAITGTLQRVAGQLQRGKPKTKSSAAVLPLPRSLALVLRRHQAAQQIERERLSEIGAWTETGYIFCSNVGTPLEPRNLVRHFKTLLVRAGLPETTRFHDLRHSCATLLIAQGEHPRVVMQYLRHTRISTTMETYGHIYEEIHALAAERLDAVLDVGEAELLELAPVDRPSQK